MNKEEMIEYFLKEIEDIKSEIKHCKNSNLPTSGRYKDLFAYETTLKLLQIKPRTIDLLEVGDVLINNDSRLKKPFGHYVTDKYVKQDLKDIYEYAKDIQIIPHEYITAWGELNK